MPQFIAVSRERHAGKKWRRAKGYAFASTQTLAPIVGLELASAPLTMPLAFFQEAGSFVLVAVLSATPGRNMLVAPDGRWLGGYIPAAFRGYPFALLPTQETDKVVLGIDADNGLAVEGDSAGEEFFDRDGNLSPALQKLSDFLMTLERSRKATNAAVASLAEAGVIRPWPVKIKTEPAGRVIGGLHRVDQAVLNALADDAFLKVRKAGALPIAYMQMLSMGLIGMFEWLAQRQAKVTPPPAAALPESLDSLFGMSSGDIIQFDELPDLSEGQSKDGLG